MFRKWIASLALFIVIVLAAACQGLAGEPQIVATLPPRPTTVPISAPQQAPDLNLGAQVFAANCTRCHGATGLGDGELVQSGQVTNVMSFADPATMNDQSPMDYFRIITEGRLETLMPPWADALTETERWAVALYVYTLPYNQQTLAQGQAVWEANCVRCHGANGQGTADGRPLPSLIEVSESAALATVANGITDQMPAFGAELSAADQAAVVAYARTLGLNNLSAPAEIAQPASTPEADSIAAAVVSGSIFGSVINGTAGAAVPPNLALTLHLLDENFSETTFETTADAQGAYVFDDVPLLTNYNYLITADYNAVNFVSEVVTVNPALSMAELPITVYELGAEASAISIDGMMTQLTATNGALQAVQIVSFANTSDRVYLNRSDTGQTSVAMSVPPDAQYHDFTGGYVISADGTQVFDTKPVIPGDSHLVHVTFIMPYTSGMSILQPLLYPVTGRYEVLSDTEGITVSSDVLIDEGPRPFGDFLMRSYAAQVALEVGQAVNYTVNGTPIVRGATVPTTTTAINPLAYLLIGVGIGSIGVAAVLYWRERANKSAKPQIAAILNTNDLMKQIAELDVQHNNGKVERKAYERQRAALKAQLTALIKGQK